jgi:benzoyl-CoA reductase/2-hydroxyglutaryl-CoA dehydratase subunit BcrC/BadD/HgdB
MVNSGKQRIKKLDASETLKKLIADYYHELDRAAKSALGKVAWCTSVGPAELLLSLDYKVYYPENHSAILGAQRLATDYIPVANAVGYSPDICSYLTSDIGAYLKRETPLRTLYGIAIPKPDVLVYNTNQCRDVQEWFLYYGREFNVPVYGVRPPKCLGDVNPEHLNCVATQLKTLGVELAKIADSELDIEKFQHVIELSLETTKLWKGIIETATNIPSPITFFDCCIHMGPAVVLRGTTQAIDYYKQLKLELDARVDNGIGAIDNEKYRLYWDGMPIWGKLRELANLFIELKCCIVASTYCNSWIFESFDPAKPFYSLAKAYTEIFINRSEEYKERYIEAMVRKYKIDGIIFHDSKTCPNNSNARYGMPQRLHEKLGIPTLIINADLNDLRCYSEEQTRTNIEAFIEQLE